MPDVNTAIFIIELIAGCTVGLAAFMLLLSGASSKGLGAPKERMTRLNGMALPKRHGR